MRRIFTNVPVIYGFSSVAPLGPQAATLLGRYLQPSAIAEVGSGRTNPRLLGAFAGESMIAVSGLSDSDPRAVHRRDVCQFIDDRLSPADKLVFIHGLLRRDMGEVRMFLERIEGLFASLTEAERQEPAFARRSRRSRTTPSCGIASCASPKTPISPIRARMIQLAASLGWLSPAEMHAELMRMIGELIGRDAVGAPEVDMICSLNKDHELDGERDRLSVSPAAASRVSTAAVQACLGSADGRARVLQALTDGVDADVRIADVFLATGPSTTWASCATWRTGSSGCRARPRRFARSTRWRGID